MKRLTPAKLSMMMFMVVGGLIAAYIAKGIFANTKPPVVAERKNIPMPVSDLPAGTMITEAHLGLGPHLASKLTRDVLLNNRVIVGRVTKEPLKAAEPILAGQLYERGVFPPLKITQGMQAVTVTMGMAAMVDGLVKPGEFVDVHFSPTSAASDKRMRSGMSMTLFKGVKILRINRLAQQGVLMGSGTNSVTLELSSEQANVLLVAQDKGTLTFSYNPVGKGDGELALKGKDKAFLDEILGLEPLPEPPAPKPNFISHIYHGVGRKRLEFRQEGNRYIETFTGSSQVAAPANPQTAPPGNPQTAPDSAPPVPAPPENPDNPQGQQSRAVDAKPVSSDAP